jgi:hypothetical protein
MASFRQIDANRRNALESTGPKTAAGKKRSRCNAIRHGLTAETVIDVLEDPEDYKAFELSVTSDFDAETAVERELVLRLASLLWRLRRATAIETGLLQIQAEIQRDLKQAGRPLPAAIARFANGGTWINHQDDVDVPHLGDTEYDGDINRPSNVNRTVARCFLRLTNLDHGAFKRLNRYEIALWRQVSQLLITLNLLRRRSCRLQSGRR